MSGGGLPRIRVQDHIQPHDRLGVIFTPAAYITDPGREVRHTDQLIGQPRKVGNMAWLKNTSVALITGEIFGESVLSFVH